MYSIYRIANKINGKYYIGYSVRPYARWMDHKNNARNNKKGVLYDSIRKYSVNNFDFEVIYQSKDKIHTHSVMEDYFIVLYQTQVPYGYNNASGGQGGSLRTGMKHSSETKEKISKARAGSKQSKETKEKISSSMSGKLNPMYGKKHSEETKQKIRDKALQRTYNPKCRDYHKGINNPTSKKYCIQTPDNTRLIIKNLAQFCRENDLSPTEMTKTVTGKARQHKGYRIIERL
jgi:group I intron endonuclease